MKSQIPTPNKLENPNDGWRDLFELVDDGAQDVDQLRGLVDVCPDRYFLPQCSVNEPEPVASFPSLLPCDHERLSFVRSGHSAVGLFDVGTYGRTGPRELVRDPAAAARREPRGDLQD